MSIGQGQRASPGPAEELPPINPSGTAQRFKIRNQVPRRIDAQVYCRLASMRAAPPTSALIKENDSISLGVEESPTERRRASAWTAMKEYYRHTVPVTALLPEDLLAIADFEETILIGLHRWVQGTDIEQVELLRWGCDGQVLRVVEAITWLRGSGRAPRSVLLRLCTDSVSSGAWRSAQLSVAAEICRADRARAVGLHRYALIREAADPALTNRQRGRLGRALAEAEHQGPFGQPVRVSRATIDRWIRDWRRGGFDALVPSPRQTTPRTPAQVLDLAAALKREVPERTAVQVAAILRAHAGWAPDERTLQRHFARLKLTTRPNGQPPAAFGGSKPTPRTSGGPGTHCTAPPWVAGRRSCARSSMIIPGC